jgi:XTP/dITP diphosphohydrolase
VLRRLIEASAIAIGVGLAVAACSAVKIGAAAIVGKANWDEIKRKEKADLAERTGVPAAGDGVVSALDGVPFGQSALALAAQLQRRAARAGVPEELTRLDGQAGPGVFGQVGEDIGVELFRLVAKARELGLDPEAELRAAAHRYRDLVRTWERSRPTPD